MDIVLGRGRGGKESGVDVARRGRGARATQLECACGRQDFEILDGRILREQDCFEYCFRDRVGRHHFLARGLGPECFPDVGIGGAREQTNDTDSFGPEFFAQSVSEA